MIKNRPGPSRQAGSADFETRPIPKQPSQVTAEYFRPLLFLKIKQQTVSRVLSWMIIYLGRMSPHASSHLLGRCRASLASASGVAPGGVYSAGMSPYRRVSSYLAFPPLPANCGRYLSVALSLESPPQDVILHPCPLELGLSSQMINLRDHLIYCYNIKGFFPLFTIPYKRYAYFLISAKCGQYHINVR